MRSVLSVPQSTLTPLPLLPPSAPREQTAKLELPSIVAARPAATPFYNHHAAVRPHQPPALVVPRASAVYPTSSYSSTPSSSTAAMNQPHPSYMDVHASHLSPAQPAYPAAHAPPAPVPYGHYPPSVLPAASSYGPPASYPPYTYSSAVSSPPSAPHVTHSLPPQPAPQLLPLPGASSLLATYLPVFLR